MKPQLRVIAGRPVADKPRDAVEFMDWARLAVIVIAVLGVIWAAVAITFALELVAS